MDSTKKYTKLTQIEHVLTRSGMYLGSVHSEEEKMYILDSERQTMTSKLVEFTPGLYKIFDEILTNAMDISTLDDTVNKIDVVLKRDSISVMNNGRGIPCVLHPDHNIYVPEMVFSNLMSGSSFGEERTTGGMNGLGAKLTAIFSTKFIVEIQDVENNIHYMQSIEKNLSVIGKPVLKRKTTSNGYVKISFIPDFERFGCSEFSDDMIKVLEKRVYDAAACTESVKVSLNGTKISIASFDKYIDYFLGKGTKKVYAKSSDARWEVAIAFSSTGFRQVSFVNNISTTKGGSHVNYVVNQIVDGLKGLAKKGEDIKPQHIKDYMFVFVKATLNNPTFSSQTKEECTSKYGSFGSKFTISEDFLKKVKTLGILEEALSISKHKQMRELTKTDGKKQISIRGIKKLEDAIRAGTKESDKCTLILCEGDSAGSFVISGLSAVTNGRYYYGLFPLRGKLLNVRGASAKQIGDNAEINNLKQILGLQQGKVYKDTSGLRYGKVLLLMDADVDGHHIKGLVMNMFHHFWPSLLGLGFVKTMYTPIIKAIKGKEQQTFYSLDKYAAWKRTASSAWAIKYFKGLGTSSATEAKECFSKVGSTTANYTYAAEDNDAVLLAFDKALANNRKQWITEATGNPVHLNYETKNVPIRDFINQDLVHFSIGDVKRSIPSVCDGLKPSQRKVVFGVLKKNLTKDEMKVANLGSYVSAETSYHHGEVSLMGTIVNLAQDFVGSNNLNLLEPRGQFGTRLLGGKDSAQPRYIFTRMMPYMKTLFDERDNPLLTHLNDDGTPIEPAYYVPTLPLILINGCSGIGTGFSTNIPNFNPDDIKRNILRFLKKEPLVDMHPWYKGFNGDIEKVGDYTYKVRGIYEQQTNGLVHIKELPIGTWTQDYKEWLEGQEKIESFENHSTESTVFFKVKVAPGTVLNHKFFNLETSLHTSNMHLFDPAGRIKKYDTVLDILKEFCTLRLEFYKLRKAHELKKLRESAAVLEEKLKFTLGVCSKHIQVFQRSRAQLVEDIERYGLVKIRGSYEHLLTIPIYHFTHDKVQELREAVKSAEESREALEKVGLSALWVKDIKNL
jgi:DNA topoisomerase II